MGHNRLGTLPATREWLDVVGHLADGASAAVVAGATSRAAVTGLRRGEGDPGVARAVFLLARTALAARRDDFAAALAADGVHVPPDLSVFDLAAGLAAAAAAPDPAAPGPRSDLGEMARLAAAETLTALVGDHAADLFPGGAEVHDAVRGFTTRNVFAALAHDFFARFARRFLLYHLGRELSHHVGGAGRFADPAAHAAFVADLDAHCREAAVIVRDYAGGWYDKNRFQQGVNREKARGFTAYALGKLRKELAARGLDRG
ncbi:hypothetical protein J0H58_23055 [bacterium]|nr:hypothetical protein [bacterium]